jgi:predicted DNA-binding protein YlxM (UPF0122 family)
VPTKIIKPIKETDSLTIAEYASIFGFTPAALIDAIFRNRGVIKKEFYSITELAERWGVSRSTVYNVLRESELKVLNIASKSAAKRDKWCVPASVVEHIENRRTESLPEIKNQEKAA